MECKLITPNEKEVLNTYQPPKGASIHFEKTGSNTAKLVPGARWEHNIISLMERLTFEFKKDSVDGPSMVAIGLPESVSGGLSITNWTVQVDTDAEMFIDKITWQFGGQASLTDEKKSVISSYSWPIYKPD